MARTAVIRTASGRVENIIELEPGTTWAPPAGCHVRAAQNAGPGDTWDGVQFVKAPDPTAPAPTAAELQRQKDVDEAAAALVESFAPARPAAEKAAMKTRTLDLVAKAQRRVA